MSNPLKKLAGQTVVYGLGTIVPRLLNYLLTPLLTVGAGSFLPAEYGINSELYAYISFFNILFTYGMETTFFNFNSKLEDKGSVYNNALLTLFASTAVFSLLLLLFTPLIANYLSTSNAVYQPRFIVWSILIIATDTLCVIPFAKLRTQNKALRFSLLKLLNVVINFSITAFFICFCRTAYLSGENNLLASLYNPETGIGYVFFANLVANVITLLLLSNEFLTLRLQFNRQLFNEMMRYTLPLVVLGLAGMVNETLDRIILKKLLENKAEAQVAQGIYGACYKIAILMTVFIQAFRFAAEPFFFGKAKEKDSRKTYAVVMKYFVIFCLLLFLGTMLNLEWIKYLVGQPYWEGLKVVPILLVANLCLGVVYNLSIWYKLSGQTKFGAIISLVGAAITVVINVAFVPTYSYMACAWATLAAYGGMMLLSYLLGQKYFPINYNIRAISVYTLVTALLYLLSYSYSGIENFTVKIVLNNLLIVLFVWLLYKLEFNNIKKLNANVNVTGKSNQ